MRKAIVHVVVYLTMVGTMVKIGYGINTLPYWIILLGGLFIYLNASID